MATVSISHILYPSNSSPLLVSSPSSSSLAPPPVSQDDLKRIAAHRAVDFVKSDMVLGLGTGSTAIHALERIADLLNSGQLKNIVGIPTSKKTEGEAKALGIPLSDLKSHPNIDLSIDGADEVDPFLNLVKGHGGSLLREKMIEGASKRFVVIVDESKWVEKPGGTRRHGEVELLLFCYCCYFNALLILFSSASSISICSSLHSSLHMSRLPPRSLLQRWQESLGMKKDDYLGDKDDIF